MGLIKNIFQKIERYRINRIISQINEEKVYFCNLHYKFKDDKEVALAAVSQNGMVINHCSEKLRDDKEVALVAVSNNGWALEHASPQIQELCKDEDPIKILETMTLYNQLEELPLTEQQIEPIKKKVKKI